MLGSYAPWRERGKTEGPGLSRAKLSSVVETPRSRRCYESRISAKWYRASCYFNNETTVPLCVYMLYGMAGYRVASKHVFRKRDWRRNRLDVCTWHKRFRDFMTRKSRNDCYSSLVNSARYAATNKSSFRQSDFISSITEQYVFLMHKYIYERCNVK